MLTAKYNKFKITIMIGIITILGTIIAIFIYNGLKDIKIELKYKNQLIEEQNEILRQK